ncbi:transposase family protein [Photobacterium phosphoreum]|uniref:transposase family protein n=1 Tax=Photobacterium phosphoreum TaxID=659 RepID=UPI001E478ECE|nr:transposase family protein [Photobacterium phosphoreum]MCD9478127.1 DDE-type integrase/transposase/recombinase [Photobacterium phosphoreum]
MPTKNGFSDESEDDDIHSDWAVRSDREMNVIKNQRRKLSESKLIPRDLDSFSSDLKKQAIERFKLLSWIAKDIGIKGWTPRNIEPLLDKYIDKLEMTRPSSRTVHRWYKAYRESDGDIKSLVNRHHNKGSREPKVKGDDTFFWQAVERLLQAEKPSVARAYEYYKDSIILANETIVSGSVPFVSYKTFNKRIKKIPPYTVALEQLGKYLADKLFRYYSSHKPPTRVLERVEIDHTPLDLVLLDDELFVPLGRPYLTMLIDVFSGCIIGFHVGFLAPSYVSVSKAIIHAVKSKDYINDLGIEFENEWPCQGKIECLVVDNGAEFWSESLDNACIEAKIRIQYNPVRKPWLKPFIERSFGVINECLLDVIPGKTFSNILEKDEYDVSQNAVMRFSTFIEEFHRWIIDVHNVKADSKCKRVPNYYWQQGCNTLPPLSMTKDEQDYFSLIMGVLIERVPTEKGIQFKELLYNSQALADYRQQYPQTKESRVKTVKVDPDDLSHIFVYLDELNGYLKVPCNDPVGYTHKLSLHQHIVILRAHKKFMSNQVNPESLARARMALHDRIAEEQDELVRSKSKNRCKGKRLKKQAEFANVGSDSGGTVKLDKLNISIDEPEQTNDKADKTLTQWDSILKDLDDE